MPRRWLYNQQALLVFLICQADAAIYVLPYTKNISDSGLLINEHTCKTAHIFPFSSLTSLLILPCIPQFTNQRKEPQKSTIQYPHMISFLNGNNDNNNKHLLNNLLCQTPCHNWHYLAFGVPMNYRSTYQGFEFHRPDMEAVIGFLILYFIKKKTK